VDYELGSIWNEVNVDYVETLSQNMPSGTEEKDENFHSGLRALEPTRSHTQSRAACRSTVRFGSSVVFS
jgi:hypothetical protein